MRWVRRGFLFAVTLWGVGLLAALAGVPYAASLVVLAAPVVVLGMLDLQAHDAVLRELPVVGHLRYFVQTVSPEVWRELAMVRDAPRAERVQRSVWTTSARPEA